MNANLFAIRCNAMQQRYRRSVLNARARRLQNLMQLSRILRQQQTIPASLEYLRSVAGGV